MTRALPCALMLMLPILRGAPMGTSPENRVVPPFAVHGASRLATMAKVGSLTGTSLLVEAGAMKPLQAPIDLETGPSTLQDALALILGPAIPFTLREEGTLLIVSTAQVTDRMLDLPLGPFHFDGNGYASLEGLLTEAFRQASGCPAVGGAWAGPDPLPNISPFHLTYATFERVVERVAEGPNAALWIVQTRARPVGCIDQPGQTWQVGAYGFGAGFSGCQMPLSSSSGPEFLPFAPPGHAFSEDCKANGGGSGSTSPPHF